MTVNGEGRDRAIEMRNGFIISITISVSISNELLYDGTIKIPSAFRQHNSRILISFVCQRTFGTKDERKRERSESQLDGVGGGGLGKRRGNSRSVFFLHFTLRLISIMQVLVRVY